MTPMEALASATRKPAEWLGLADSVGTVAPGKVADVVLLDANPLADIRNTRRIVAVMVRGHLFQRKQLRRLRRAAGCLPAYFTIEDRQSDIWVAEVARR